jgi:N-acetylglucosaminyldiphosphoundecaprenol N-acetyl-beta-D-mannosaminyltransferase
MGIRIDRLDMDQAVRRCDEVIRSGGFAQQVSINAAKVVALSEDPRMRAFVQRCELVNADGQAIVWASRLLGDPLPERVAGIDLMERLLALADLQGYAVYFLGATEEALRQAIEVVRRRYPSLRLAGYRNGYFDESESESIAERIRASNAQLLFVGMSSPRKEYWLDDHAVRAGVSLAMGVGGAIDVLAGVTPRAPRLLQRLGLEWSARLCREPRRLLRRYTVTNARFLRMLANELLRRGLRPGSRSQAKP